MHVRDLISAGPSGDPELRRRPGAGTGSTAIALRPRALFVFAVLASSLHGAVEGMPLTRLYPYEEIGRVSRGVHLNFDPLGRVAVVQEDEYIVLNDDAWLRLGGEALAGTSLYAATTDIDGALWYGALGSWGVLRPTPTGQLRPESLLPADYPKWVLATNFSQIVCRPEGVYLAGWNGVVFWDRKTQVHRFFEVPGVSHLFAFEDRLFVSSHDRGVLILDVARDTLVGPDRDEFGSIVIGRFASAGGDSALLSTTYRRLLRYRAGELTQLPPPLGPQLPAAVEALQSLPEGDVAAAIAGMGLHIVSPEGRVRLSLTGPEFARVHALANNEPGVLWAATEAGLFKVLYGQPFTTFGQSLGLPVSWPQVVLWQGQIVVASAGRLYAPIEPADGTTHFQLIPQQPGAGTWGIAVAGSSLLVSNYSGIYVREPGEEFALAVPEVAGARIVSIDADTCIAIGPKEIAAVRRQDGRWVECAARIPGLGYPAIVHAGKNSAWIELGVNRAARISLNAGRLESRLFETFPWGRPSWVNVSVLGATTVLAGSENKRVYFDEDEQTLVERPELEALFDQTPFPLMRIRQDDTGTFWGSHQHGILSFTLEQGQPKFDTASYASVDERLPLVRTLPGGDVWLSTGQSLYHLDRRRLPGAEQRFKPVLVAVRDSRTNAELRHGGEQPVLPRPLRYDENSVAFEFFAGSYASMRPPAYEYSLNERPWEAVRSGSAVVLSDLREGQYRLGVRLVDGRGPIGSPRQFAFEVTAPWYRTWTAIASYPLLAGAVLFGLLRFSMRRAEARNAALERIIAQRTRELQATMLKLQHETQTSATLAERNRLAGEIHDSLEQGFTGLTLQLETTAAFTSCPPEVKSGLAVAINMVAFSRDEVRHAVRDMHSPILAAAGLETALSRILAQIAPHAGYASLRVEGTPRRLGSTLEHHLLRIAQEAIANAVKHASANHLEVTLAFHPAEVELRICDDGRGFDAAAVLQAGIGHFGLPSFRGRASKLGGTVTIDSRPGAGTRITVRVPAGTTTPD